MSRLMTRRKTFGSEQVDLILENLVESTHSLLVSTHSPFFFEPCSFGSEQVNSILGNSVGVDSPTPYVDSKVDSTLE